MSSHTDFAAGDHVTNGTLIMRVKRSSEAGIVCTWDKGKKTLTFAPRSLQKVNVGGPIRKPARRYA